jgi:hypothetical protein
MDNNAVTVAIVEEFIEIIDKTKSYTLKEIKDILSTVYKTKTTKTKDTKKTKKLDDDGNVKPKRKPSTYNLYIKARVEELKKEDPSSTAIDRMKEAASSWKLLSDEKKNEYKQEE